MLDTSIVRGAFRQTQVVVAIPKNSPAALSYVESWMKTAKESGLVRLIFAAHGLNGETVVP